MASGGQAGFWVWLNSTPPKAIFVQADHFKVGPGGQLSLFSEDNLVAYSPPDKWLGLRFTKSSLYSCGSAEIPSA
jgi:hypothetical protein